MHLPTMARCDADVVSPAPIYNGAIPYDILHVHRSAVDILHDPRHHNRFSVHMPPRLVWHLRQLGRPYEFLERARPDPTTYLSWKTRVL